MEYSKEKQIEETPKIQPINYKISNKAINEMRYLADEMGKAISTEYKKRVLADERKLEEVLKANGWVKSSDVAEEIFAEIEEHIITKLPILGSDIVAHLAELKKKYTEEGK